MEPEINVKKREPDQAEDITCKAVVKGVKGGNGGREGGVSPTFRDFKGETGQPSCLRLRDGQIQLWSSRVDNVSDRPMLSF
jgi:hypothetical protein